MKILIPICLVVLVASLTGAITCKYEEVYKGTKQLPWEPAGDCTPSSSYSVREYYTGHWAVTKPTPNQGFFFEWNEFKKLYDYISNSNIPMTTPVLNFYKLRSWWTHLAMERQYQEIEWMGFYLNSDVRPTPKDPTVKLLEFPRMTVYVKEYSGYTTEEKNLKYLKKLKEELTTDGIEFDDSTYYSAVYDSPWQKLKRRNEVWLVKL